jgi:hypothetical protein
VSQVATVTIMTGTAGAKSAMPTAKLACGLVAHANVKR